MRVAGIDGCKDGWIAVCVDSGDFKNAKIVWDVDVRNLLESNSIDFALVDMPIGFSSGPKDREVEQSARTFLKGKSSSVFNVPCRQALKELEFEGASEINRAVVGKGISKQTWSIAPKMREVENAVLSVGQERLKEGHPEISFALLVGKPVLAPKKSARGLFERSRAMSGLGFDVLESAMVLPEKHRAAPDDLLDAAVLAWSALRVKANNHRSFPSVPAKDSAGLEMAILA